MTTTKRNKIIYWIATIWLALGMISTAIVQLMQMKEEVDNVTRLGYPPYILTIIGVWKNFGRGGHPDPEISFGKGMGLCRIFSLL